MILVGIDDTDSLESRGTNKLARELARQVSVKFRCRAIVRHQLLFDLRVPFTSHNGSACIWLEARSVAATDADLATLYDDMRVGMLADFIEGSDPGLCLATHVPPEITAWGRRCQQEIVTQAEARDLATRCGIRLEGLGGTNGGVIGALAAIGLTADGNDGRLVQWQEWPDELTGPTPVERLWERDIEVRTLTGDAVGNPRPNRSDGRELQTGIVDVGKHARANLREHRACLFVVAATPEAKSNLRENCTGDRSGVRHKMQSSQDRGVDAASLAVQGISAADQFSTASQLDDLVEWVAVKLK